MKRTLTLLAAPRSMPFKAAKLAFPALLFTLALACASFGGEFRPAKRVLFFSKAASWEKKIAHRTGNELSYLETALRKLGQENHIEFTFSKDGGIFTPANIAGFDAFFFFTSGDLTSQSRNGRGDNYPLMSLDGKKALLDAIRNGKGFIGCNTAVYTFIEPVSPGEPRNETNTYRYTRMIGAGYIGHNEVQRGSLIQVDRAFPGMEKVPMDYQPLDQWYGFKTFMPDLHVIIALNAARMTGNLYERPNYPIAWARMEGAGRVFYTTMGHVPEIWEDPVFLQMLLGGIRWTAGLVDADVTPNISAVTPNANEIPEGARKFVASNPPLENPHFPNFKVWSSQPPIVKGFGDHAENADQRPEERNAESNARAFSEDKRKRVLFFSKSAGYEHAIAYRDTAWPSFIEREMLAFGEEHQIDFTFSKDGGIFTPENIGKYDAFFFYTTGDLTRQARDGRGDNHPLMTLEGKAALLRAIREGKGLIGAHCAIDTFSDDPEPAGPEASQLANYGRMLGARYLGHGDEQPGHLIQFDSKFPGMEKVPVNYYPLDLWSAFGHFMPDIHVLLELDCAHMKGDLYARPNYPAAWARMEGKGRVFYTAMGHEAAIWKDPVFRQMILGGVRWATGAADADVTPNLGNTTPQANEIPERADLKITTESAPPKSD